jgi:hypothetical protein
MIIEKESIPSRLTVALGGNDIFWVGSQGSRETPLCLPPLRALLGVALKTVSVSLQAAGLSCRELE